MFFFCGSCFPSDTAIHHLGTHKSNSVVAGDGFQQWNQNGCKSTISLFHFKERIKIVSPDSIVLGQGKDGIRLMSNAAPFQLGQHFPTFTHIFLAAR